MVSKDGPPHSGAAPGRVTTCTKSTCNPDADEESPLLGNSQTRSLSEEPSNTYLVIVLGSVFMGVFLAALDTTIVATLAVPISTSFNSLNLLSWLGSSYLIANAACQPLSGRLTDIFSRRSGLVVSNTLFAVGTLICGLAQTEGAILAGRVVAGIGGGGLNSISTFVASDLVPLRKRGVTQGVAHICYGVGAGLGGLFGGWMNDAWGWRAAFLSRVPLIIVSGLLACLTLRTPKAAPKASEKSRLSRVDFAGAFTLALALVLLLLGLNSGGNVVPWTHPLVLVSLPLSAVALGAFVFVETRWAKEPIIPMKLLLNRTVLSACSMNSLITMVLFMATYYVPVFFQVSGSSATASGVRLIPQSIGTSIASLGCGYTMKRTGKYKKLGLAIVACSVVGFAGLSTMTPATPAFPPFLYLALVGVGYGGMMSVSLLATIASVSPEDQAVATSAIYAFRSTGSTVGVTVASVVYQNLLQAGLHARFDGWEGSAEVIKRIIDSLDELKHLPEGWSEGVYEAYGVALRGVFLTGLGCAVLGLVGTSFMREYKLHNTMSRADDDE
ncbi:hypothetical protein ACO1O0_005455 [Amphichorda felina]